MNICASAITSSNKAMEDVQEMQQLNTEIKMTDQFAKALEMKLSSLDSTNDDSAIRFEYGDGEYDLQDF